MLARLMTRDSSTRLDSSNFATISRNTPWHSMIESSMKHIQMTPRSAPTRPGVNEGSRLQNSLGRTDLAENYIRRALLLVESLRSERPDDLDNIRAHVDCLSKLAAYLTDSHRDQAMQSRSTSHRAGRTTRSAAPDDPAIQDQLAACHNNYANTLDPKMADEILLHFQQAIEIRQRIDPMRLPGVRMKLAESLINQGNLQWHSRNYPAAEQSSVGPRKSCCPTTPRFSLPVMSLAWSAPSMSTGAECSTAHDVVTRPSTVLTRD